MSTITQLATNELSNAAKEQHSDTSCYDDITIAGAAADVAVAAVTIAPSADESNSNAENKAESGGQPLIITTLPESTNAYDVDSDIYRNSSDNCMDATSCEIIVSVLTKDAPQNMNIKYESEYSMLIVDERNSKTPEIQATTQPDQITTNAFVHLDETPLSVDITNLANQTTNQHIISDTHTSSCDLNYTEINQSNTEPEDQTASISVSHDANDRNISLKRDEGETNSDNTHTQHQLFITNSTKEMMESLTKCDVDDDDNNSNHWNQVQSQINELQVDDEQKISENFNQELTKETQTDELNNLKVRISEFNTKHHVYRVESPELTGMNLNMTETMIRESDSVNDSSVFGIQELSDIGSSAENDKSPLVSEVESETETATQQPCKNVPKLQFQNQLLSVETLPLDDTEPSSESVSKLEPEQSEPNQTTGIDLDCVSDQFDDKSSSQQSPTMVKRQKRLPLPPPPMTSPFLNPMNNFLQAISEENSDASDIESMESIDKLNRAKPNKSDAIYPRSNFDFSCVSRHTHLQSPSTEAIREEQPCIRVDIKVIDSSLSSSEITNQPWMTSKTDEKHHAELVYLNSDSSNASLSDIESISGIDGDVEDLTSETDVRIETPTIGGTSFSAFTPITKKSPTDENHKTYSNSTKDNNLFQSNTCNEMHDCMSFISKPQIMSDPTEINLVTNLSPIIIDHSFQPINDEKCSIRTVSANLAETPTESLNNNSIDSSQTDCDNSNVANKGHLQQNQTQTQHIDSKTDIYSLSPITQTQSKSQPQTQTNEKHQQSNDKQSEYLITSEFKIDEPDGNTMITSILNTGNVNENNCLDSITNNNNQFYRQDSTSSPSSSHTNSTSHSQCTAKYLANRSSLSPCDLHDFHDPVCIKSLRQLSFERINTLPYGDVILNELAKTSQYLKDHEMPYPPPKLPRIEDLEIPFKLAATHQPRPPPRCYQSRIKFFSNYIVKASPSPPPVPNRPWLGVPTTENPNVLVCLSPAQRKLFHKNSAPDHLLDLHNKFVDRRGYYEFTDDEVMAINFRETVTPVTAPKSAAQCEMSNMKPKDDNRLLALIREINQLTQNSNSSNESVAHEKETMPQTNQSHTQSPVHQPTEHSTLKMSRSSATTTTSSSSSSSSTSRSTYFNNKRFSNYFDELNRLHPIVEETTPKVYTNAESSIYQSRKRIENGQIVNEFSDLRHDKFSNDTNVQQNNQCNNVATVLADNNGRTEQTTFNRSATAAFDLNIEKKLTTAPTTTTTTSSVGAFNANPIENRYCKYGECKNSQTNESVQEKQELHPSENTNNNNNITDESLKKCADPSEQQASDSNRSRFSFKEFDFVPKMFTNFFRSNQTNDQQLQNTEPTNQTKIVQTNSEQHTEQIIKTTKTIESSDECERSTSISPLPFKTAERCSSTQSLYDWFSDERERFIPVIPDRPPSATNLSVKSPINRGRISPNPIRAPRLTDPPPSSPQLNNYNKNGGSYSQRHYDWNRSRNFENRQSMIDQTPITRHITKITQRRMSLPKAMADNQLADILAKEQKISIEFDKLERDRLRLLNELEEMRVNQNFEDFCKEHKKRNSLLPTMEQHLSEEEVQKKRMQEEWLHKVAEREERRLHKIIKVTHSSLSEIAPNIKSNTNRGLGDEFLERVKERQFKLQIPSDSDTDSQSIQTDRVSPNTVDSTVKIIDDGREADLKNLPKHLREFAELTTKLEQCGQQACDTIKTSIINTNQSNEIIHTIVRCDNEDGESCNANSTMHLTTVGFCVCVLLPFIICLLS